MDNKLLKEIEILKKEREQVVQDLKEAKKTNKKNHDFAEFIESKHLSVKTPDGNKIPVNLDTICNLKEIIAFSDNEVISLKYKKHLCDVKIKKLMSK